MNKKYFINVIIGLAFMFLFPLLPAFGGITDVGMSILGIFIGMIWLWVTVDSMWSSLLALVLTGLSGYIADATGYAGVQSVLTTAFGNETVITIMLCLILFGLITEVNLGSQVASLFLGRKVLEGRPYLLLFMFMLCSYVMSGLSVAMLSLFILWPVALEICNKCHYDKSSKLSCILICSIFLGAAVGQPLLPFKGIVAVMFNTYATNMGVTINSAVYIFFNIIMALIFFALYVLMVKFILRPDVEELKSLKVETVIAKREKMNSAQIVVVVLIAVLVLSIVITGILPSTIPGVGLLTDYGILGMLVVLIAVALILRDKEGNALIPMKSSMKKNFSWDMFFQCTAAVYMANALTDSSTGIRSLLQSALNNVFSGIPAIVFVVLLIAFALLISQVVNNLVIGVISITVAVSYASSLQGVNYMALCVMIMLSVCVALLLPSGSVYCSMLHARKDLVSFKQIMYVFIPAVILAVVVYAAIGYPLGCLFFS